MPIEKPSWWNKRTFQKALDVGGDMATYAIHLTSTTTAIGKGAVLLGGVRSLSRYRDGLTEYLTRKYPRITLPFPASQVLTRLFLEKNLAKLEVEQGSWEILSFRPGINDVKTLRWVLAYRGSSYQHTDGVWYEGGTQEQVMEALGRVVWETLGDRVAYKRGTEPPYKDMAILVSDDHSTHSPSEKAQEIHETVARYNAKGYSRALLLHGPPGTGKSHIARHIAHLRGGFSLRQVPERMGSSLLSFAQMLRPKTIIIDDVDRDPPSQLLDTIELTKKYCSLVLVTANYPEQLDAALKRPGRFDEMHAIESLDATVYTSMFPDLDEETLKRVKKIPVAYGEEFRRTREVEGHDKSLERLTELEKRAEEIAKEPSPDDKKKK